MPHFTQLRTRFTNAEFLLSALKDLGFDQVEAHADAQSLYGYRGDRRPEKAHLIIRRVHIGPASNDIGFHLAPSGTYEAIISEFDRSQGYSHTWLGQLSQRYAYRAARSELEQQGFAVAAEETTTSGQIHLTLRRAH